MTSVKNATYEIDRIKGQKLFYDLMGFIYQHKELNPEIRRIVHGWDLEANLGGDDPKWKMAKEELFTRYKSGMLPRGQIFSVYYPDLLEEAVLIFKAFYYAPSYSDLMGVVYWAHMHLNEKQFTYSLYAACVHAEKIQWIPVPQPYEVNPELFFNTDVMRQVHEYKMNLIHGGDKTRAEPVKIIEGKYTNWYIKDTSDNEHDLTYFMEDVGLSTWYCYFHMRYSFWMSGEEYPSVPVKERGEIFYFLHKVLLNRYRLERLSHDLDEMDPIDWEKEITVGYSPNMNYHNGMHFPRRSERTKIPVWKNEDLQKLKEFESRISKVVDSGYMMTKDGRLENIRSNEGFNKFSSLVQGNNDSLNINYYGSVEAFGKRVIGFSPKPQNRYQVLPSAVENHATCWRDPAFYRLLQRNYSLFVRFKEHMVAHTREELAFAGVSIESARIVEKDVITYMEDVDVLIETMTYTDRQNVPRTSEIKVRQQRLNNKPYTYEIKIHSAKNVGASIRIFIGPKYNVYGKEIRDNYADFYQVDYFLQDLKKGSNTILRSRLQHAWDTIDHISSEKYKKPFESEKEFIGFYKRRFGFPGRLIMPRGKIGGMPVQFYVYVCEFDPNMHQNSEPFLREYDGKPLGFPLDRPIFDFNFPNMHFFDSVIYHKKKSSVNLTE